MLPLPKETRPRPGEFIQLIWRWRAGNVPTGEGFIQTLPYKGFTREHIIYIYSQCFNCYIIKDLLGGWRVKEWKN